MGNQRLTQTHAPAQKAQSKPVMKMSRKPQEDGWENLQGIGSNRALNEAIAQPDSQTRSHQKSHNGNTTFRGLSSEIRVFAPTQGLIIQPKLVIGQPNDKYEQEADRVAQHVVQQLNTPKTVQPVSAPIIQREVIPDEEEDSLQMKPMLQRQFQVGEEAVSPELESKIHQMSGGGQPLPSSIREPMERAFGTDFSQVRVHTDGDSHQLNTALQARAFTTGQDVFLRQGAYEPGTREGQELIAHELTHVTQQNAQITQRQNSRIPLASTNMVHNNPIQRIIGKVGGGVTVSLQADPLLYIQKLMQDSQKRSKDRYQEALDLANEYYANTGDTKYAHLAAECAIQLQKYTLAARFYKAAYRKDKQPLDALKAARNYQQANEPRKADIWYRIVRRGYWENKGQKVTHATQATPTMIAEANRHLGRLVPEEKVKYREFLKLEDRTSTDHNGRVHSLYEGEEGYKKEEKPVLSGNTIATQKVDEWTKKLGKQELTVTQFQQKLLDFDINPAQMKKYIVHYNRRDTERADLELKAGNGGITQGVPPTLFSTNNMHSVASGAKYAIFAMSRSGRIYATNHRISRVHHTSPLAGGDVAAAGEMVVQNGVLLCITNKSGHYAPDERHLVQVLQEIQGRFNVNLANVQLKFFDDDGSVFWPGGASRFLQDVQNRNFVTQLQQLKQAKASNNVDPNSWSPP